ncbi:MAG: glycosyltransferase family 4 protein [Melioribacteraceae bacterium]|nr:glycosyltransferase family 4 protein [Melioribacteraceae bacterium]MCF8264207.1 glycosyltransferase family 4 protein [Melioribacteraceae bacterium]
MKSNQKKILILDHDPQITGSSVSLKYVLRHLANSGFLLILYTTKNEINEKYFSGNSLKVARLNKIYNLNIHFSSKTSFTSLVGIYSGVLSLWRFTAGIFLSTKIMIKEKPALIIINEYVLLQFGIIPRIFGIPVIVYVRSRFLYGPFGLFSKLIKQSLLLFADELICISEVEQNQFGNSKKAKIVREFVEHPKLTDKDQVGESFARINIPQDQKLIINLGGISHFKGTFIAIKAFEIAAETFDNIQLLIVGGYKKDEKYSMELIDYVKKSKFPERIHILGYVEKADSLFTNNSILISTNLDSHFQRPIIEAWAKSVPAIASDTLHTKMLFNAGEDLLMYSKQDINDLAQKLKTLLSDETLKQKIVENAKISLKKNYDAEYNFQALSDIVLKYVGRK